MAIDDNTSYELTGAQVKDLANKIKGKAADNTFVGATSAAPGSKGLVPEPQAGDNTKFLSGDGTWKDVPAGSSYTAGNGIDITNNVISADTNVLATTKLVKDLSGGAIRVANRINVSRLSDYDEATVISNQINNPDVYPALVQSTLGYAFYDVNLSKYLNRDEIGQAIDENCNFVYFSTTDDDGYGQKIIVNAKSNYNREAKTYSPSFLVYKINAETPYGGGKMYTLSLNASTQPGLEDWYETSSSTWAYEPAFVIQRMTTTEAQDIANEINANNTGIEVTPSQVREYMKFVCRSTSTGKMIKTASDFRSALYRANTGYVLFLPTMAGAYATLETMVYRGGSSSNAGFNLMDMGTSVVTPYNIVNPSASYGENAEYMWYVVEANNASAYQLSYGYTNAVTGSAPTDAPETAFQTAVDASGNLYMASGSSSASDWKQINNAPASVTYYLQKQSTAGMSGISTYIYTDAGRTTPAAPATLVADFKAGKTILLEYEQDATPYSITFQVNSASADGDPAVECQYKLLISELNKGTGTYNAVTTQLSATVTAGTEFNGKWTTVRAVLPTVNNGALTIQQNGTTLDTFTANSSDNKTVNIQTITAETVAPSEEVGAITTNMIANGAVTSAKVDWSTIKCSAPIPTVLQTIGTVRSNRSYTVPDNGFLLGKGVALTSGSKAGVFLTDSDTYCIGGIPFTDYSGNIQVAFCVPVYKGQTVYLRMSGGSSRLEEVKLVASHSEASI